MACSTRQEELMRMAIAVTSVFLSLACSGQTSMTGAQGRWAGPVAFFSQDCASHMTFGMLNQGTAVVDIDASGGAMATYTWDGIPMAETCDFLLMSNGGALTVVPPGSCPARPEV